MAFRHWLRGPGIVPIEPAFVVGPAAEWQFGVARAGRAAGSGLVSARPAAGRIWARASVTPDGTVLSLVNLLHVADPSWDRAQPPSRPVAVTVTLPQHLKAPACRLASPDDGLEQLAVTGSSEGFTVRVPLRQWSLVHIADKLSR